MLTELVLRAELQVVAASPARDEPREGVVEPVDHHGSDVRLYIAGLIVEVDVLQRGRRQRIVFGLLVESGASIGLLVHPRGAHRVQLCAADDPVVGAHQRLVVVYLDVIGVLRAVAKGLVVVRLVIPQKPHGIVVVAVQLVIHTSQVVPGVRQFNPREALVRPRRVDAAVAFVESQALEAAEEVGLVADERPADRAAPLLLACVRLLEVLLFDKEVLGRQARVGVVAKRAAAEGVGALLGHGVDDAGRGGAVLGIELARHDLEFLNRFHRGACLGARAAPAQVVVVAPAVHQVLNAGSVLAVDGDAVRARG